MANNREISQFAGLITVNDTSSNVSIGASVIVGTGITFNAGDGTAAFAARVDVGSTSHNKHSLVALNNSSQTVVVAIAHSTAACFEGRSDASTTTSLIDNDGCLKIGGTLPSSPNIQLRADGSATLTQVATATESVNGRNIQAGGGDGNNTIFYGASDTAMTDPVFRVWTDGSMYAADDLFAIASTADTRIGTDSITISGTATRSKVHIDPGGWIGSGDVYPPCVAVYAPINAVDSKYVWVCYDDASTGTSSYITAGGAAEFAGTVKSADGVQGGGNASCGWQLDPGSSTGLISVQGKSTGAATNAIFQGWYGSDNTIRFNCSGDATFDGHIGIGTPFRSNESRIESAFDSNTTVGLVLRNSSTGTCARIVYGSTIIGSITNTSTVTSYNTTSDYRLKENVVGISGAIDRVKQLSPKRFNFKVDEDVTVDGFIAHEVSSIVPEAISGEKDAMRDEEYEVTPAVEASEGVDAVPAVMRTRSVPDYQGIDQSKLIPLLTAALQEAITKIETLETKVAALEGS